MKDLKDELIEKLKETIMHVGFGTDTPIEKLCDELRNAGCKDCEKFADEIFQLEQSISSIVKEEPKELREELIKFLQWKNWKAFTDMSYPEIVDEYLTTVKK